MGNRDKQLPIRLSEGERITFAAGAEPQGMPVSAWLRWLGKRERDRQLAEGAPLSDAEKALRKAAKRA
jgi:hypothetical protein